MKGKTAMSDTKNMGFFEALTVTISNVMTAIDDFEKSQLAAKQEMASKHIAYQPHDKTECPMCKLEREAKSDSNECSRHGADCSMKCRYRRGYVIPCTVHTFTKDSCTDDCKYRNEK